MKLLRITCLSAAVLGLTLSAYADSVPANDFVARVLDPPLTSPAPADSYSVTPITTLDFAVTFTACVAGELPGGATADGCFAGENDSPSAWTALDLFFVNNDALGDQPVSCPITTGDHSFFGVADCTIDDGLYHLGFDMGTIPTNDGNASIFFITETGVDPADFPTGSAYANQPNVQLAATPEPDSLLLMMTGMLGFAGMLNPRLRSLIRRS